MRPVSARPAVAESGKPLDLRGRRQYHGAMLVGRGEELARIAALLEHAQSGVSGALILRGEPGIGKSALLREALTPAEGMTILSATGIEAESELPFSGLSELLLPLLDLLPEIPGPQADALAAALGLGPAVAPDPFAVSAAPLSLLAGAAGRSARRSASPVAGYRPIEWPVSLVSARARPSSSGRRGSRSWPLMASA